MRAVSVAQAVASRSGLARYLSRCIGPFLAVPNDYDDFGETIRFTEVAPISAIPSKIRAVRDL